MKKRMLSLLLVLVLVIVAMAGCNSGSNSGTAEPSATDANTEEADAKADAKADGAEASEESAEAPASGDKKTIGVASNNFNDKWQTYMLDAIRAEAEKYPNYEFIFADGNEDPSKQIGQVEDFISSGVDGIILVAVNTDTAAPMTQACKDASIPLVTVNRLLANQEEATAYVGSKSIEAGIMAAELAFEKNPNAKVAVLMGPAGNEAAVMRTEGYHQVAEESYPGVTFVAEEIGNWNRDEGMTIVENWLQAGIDFDMILSNNDEMAMGAILALEGANVRENYYVAGIDATIDALEFMKEGRLDLTIYQSADGQGRGAVDTMVKAVEGSLTESEVWIAYEPVTPDKVDEYIAKW